MNTYKSLKQAAADGRAAQQKMAANVASQSQIQITITGQFTRRHTGLVVNPVALTLHHAGKTITVY